MCWHRLQLRPVHARARRPRPTERARTLPWRLLTRVSYAVTVLRCAAPRITLRSALCTFIHTARAAYFLLCHSRRLAARSRCLSRLSRERVASRQVRCAISPLVCTYLACVSAMLTSARVRVRVCVIGYECMSRLYEFLWEMSLIPRFPRSFPSFPLLLSLSLRRAVDAVTACACVRERVRMRACLDVKSASRVGDALRSIASSPGFFTWLLPRAAATTTTTTTSSVSMVTAGSGDVRWVYKLPSIPRFVFDPRLRLDRVQVFSQ